MSVKYSRQSVRTYSDENLNHVAFPLGGMGAGMICLEGSGAISNVSIKHEPNVFCEPYFFSALTISGGTKKTSLVLESPVPERKIFGPPGTANGAGDRSYGLPRFEKSEFSSKFPFSEIKLSDREFPLKVKITGWSPFVPLDPDNSSLPVAALEFTFKNSSKNKIQAVYSFNSKNFIKTGSGGDSVKKIKGCFVFRQKGDENAAWNESYFCARTDDPSAKVNPAWFRGAWFDEVTMTWKDIAAGRCVDKPEAAENEPSPGASLFVPFVLKPGEEKTVRLMLSWFVPYSNICIPEMQKKDCGGACCTSEKKEIKKDVKDNYRPWYSSRFTDIESVAAYWLDNYCSLRQKSLKFSNTFFDSTLPIEILEAINANLSILKSPTVMRQYDGRLWCWEGCCDKGGCCHGSCTHVWNYAQAMAHLFPSLERSLRETEFNECQSEIGHQNFRAWLPIRPSDHILQAAADGQLGGIMKACREWKISGDTKWLKKMWPKIKKSLEYCIDTWDPKRNGILEEPHHNTYDVEFWGADGMHASIYLGALKAGILMEEAVGEDSSIYNKIFGKALKYFENELFNGKYFIQKIKWKGLKAPNPATVNTIGTAKNVNISGLSKDAIKLLQKEGPKYQYGEGCLSDGVIGAWFALVCGLGEISDGRKIKKHLLSVFKHNLKHDLSKHCNPQRPSFAIGKEGGLLLCTWPDGGELSIPFPYSDEVWTGIEYQVASHLMFLGLVKEGVEIVKIVRDRYDGRKRNPFNEYECGHWYGRALASYGLLQGLTGIRYDAVEKTLHINPRIKGDFKSFLCTATGYGIAGIKKGKPFCQTVEGKIDVLKIVKT